MKGKFIRVLIALVLVLGFSSVTAVPAGAADTLNVIPFTLNDVSGGTAVWSMVDKHSGDYSVLLSDGGTVGSAGTVEFTVNIPLADITDLSFWFNHDTPDAAFDNFIPALSLHLDTNDDGEQDAAVALNADTAGTPLFADGTWDQWTLAEWDNWHDSEAEWNMTLAYAQAKFDGAMVLHVMVGEGGWGSGAWTANTAYVDDIAITTTTTTTYDLEGTSDDYTTIQSAIDIANPDDTITVQAGIYVENVNVDKSLTLTGASSATVTVNAADPNVSVFNVTADSVNISGFTVSGTTADGNAGIRFPAHVEDCNIHDNIVTGNIYGILLLDAEDSVISGNNTFASNTVSNNTVSGIEMQHTYGNTFTNNTANSNGRYGFTLDSSRNNTFTGNTASSNGREGFWLKQGQGTDGSNYNTLTNNTANSNTWSGIHITNFCGDSTYTGNTFDSNGVAGMKLGGSSGDTTDNLTVNSNSFSGNPIGILIDAGAVITDVVLRYNNIVGNTSYGVSNAGTGTVDAENNWWGNASGSIDGDDGAYTAYGDDVSTNVDYQPWLLAVVNIEDPDPTTYEATAALLDTWTLFSVDKEVTTGTDWTATVAYKYTAGTGYTEVTVATLLTSVDAYYLKTSGGGGVGITYSTSSPGVVTKDLAAGWNIISCAALTDAYNLLTQLRYAQIGEQEGAGVTNLVGQGSYNQFTSSIAQPLATAGDWTQITGDGNGGGSPVPLNAFDGYWVHMNAAKSFGVIPD